MNNEIKDLISQSKVAFLTALVTILLSPFALYMTLTFTDILRKSDIRIVEISHDAPIRNLSFNKNIKEILLKNSEITNEIFTELVFSLINLQKSKTINDNIMLEMVTIALNSIKKGNFDNISPIGAAYLIPILTKIYDLHHVRFVFLQQNIAKLENKKNIAFSDLIEVDDIKIKSREDIYKYGGVEGLMRKYKDMLYEHKKHKTILKMLINYLKANSGIEKIVRENQCSFTVGLVNYGYSTGIVKKEAKITIKGNTYPLIKIESPYTPVPTKEYVEVKYGIGNFTDKQLNEWQKVINGKKSFQYSITINTSQKTITYTGKFPSILKEYGGIYK